MRTKKTLKTPRPKLSPITETILNLCDNLPGYSRAKLLEEIIGPAEPEEWYTAAEVAKMFKVTVRTVIKWKESGWLVPSFKIEGGTVRYSMEDIRKVVQNGR